jgi:hypothetical protein
MLCFLSGEDYGQNWPMVADTLIKKFQLAFAWNRNLSWLIIETILTDNFAIPPERFQNQTTTLHFLHQYSCWRCCQANAINSNKTNW